MPCAQGEVIGSELEAHLASTWANPAERKFPSARSLVQWGRDGAEGLLQKVSGQTGQALSRASPNNLWNSAVAATRFGYAPPLPPRKRVWKKKRREKKGSQDSHPAQ